MKPKPSPINVNGLDTWLIPPIVFGHIWIGHAVLETAKEVAEEAEKEWDIDPRLLLILPFTPTLASNTNRVTQSIKWAIYYADDGSHTAITVVDDYDGVAPNYCLNGDGELVDD